MFSYHYNEMIVYNMHIRVVFCVESQQKQVQQIQQHTVSKQ